LRSGLDAAKALALGASLAALAQPVLQAAIEGVKRTRKMMRILIEELRNTMFLVGAENLQQLHKVSLVITGKVAEWLRLRGFDIEVYARRSGS
jgi:isopentenyl-diphosphate delta-isomerase